MVFAFAGDSTITRFFAISIFAFSSLCCLCVLCVSVVTFSKPFLPTETQRTQRLHREYLHPSHKTSTGQRPHELSNFQIEQRGRQLRNRQLTLIKKPINMRRAVRCQ